MPREIKPPRQLMPRISWSLGEPTPSSAEGLVEQLEAYAKKIDRKLNRRELRKLFPGPKLDIQFQYYEQRRNRDWDMISAVVKVRSKGKPLTYAQILFQLHKSAFRHLKNQDHRYFEGLYLIDQPPTRDIPLYELFLGS